MNLTDAGEIRFTHQPAHIQLDRSSATTTLGESHARTLYLPALREEALDVNYANQLRHRFHELYENVALSPSLISG